MANTVIRVYDDFDAAEQARDTLLQAGFTKEEVQLTSREDESGAVHGNFITGDGTTTRDRHDGGLFRVRSGNDDSNYGRDFAPADPQRGAAYILTVDAADEGGARQASEIMDRFGAIDIDALTARRRGDLHAGS